MLKLYVGFLFYLNYKMGFNYGLKQCSISFQNSTMSRSIHRASFGEGVKGTNSGFEKYERTYYKISTNIR
jgi:hypothetical protein